MIRQIVLFEGQDANGANGLWETNGTAAGTFELTGINGVDVYGLAPNGFTVFNGKVLFVGDDNNGVKGLWVTDGTAAGTQELAGISGASPNGLFYNFGPSNFTIFNDEVLFAGANTSGFGGLWVTNGTAAGTHELTGISGANANGFYPYGFTVFNGEVLFEGEGDDLSGHYGLWVTNGTAAGTQELTGISGVNANGFYPSGFTVFNREVLFEGNDLSGNSGLWVTNGAAAGTHELTGISGASPAGLFNNGGPNFTVFNDEVLFNGTDTSGFIGLWVTNGTAAGTQELTGISGANHYGLFSNDQLPNFTVFNDEVLFNGTDVNGNNGLWVTNGTTAGTQELTGIIGANPGGLAPRDFMVFNGRVLFEGNASSDGTTLWETDGTAAGTHRWNIRVVIGRASTPFTELVPPPDDFLGNNTSDILFRDTASGDTWFEAISNGAFASWSQIGGSDTTYGVVGTGDFFGTGTSDILYRNSSTGFTAFEATSNGAFASWNQIGGSNTSYGVVGVGDFYATGTDDILFRNSSTGDTWFEQMGANNDPFAGWHQIGGSDTHYAVVGLGDFFGIGADDILLRNNSTGDTWLEAISNGAFAGWSEIGGSNTHYSVVGVGDFFGNGANEILFRNNSTGDIWFEAVSSGASAGWHQIGGSDTTYSVVGIGDYFGTNTSDILFRNASTGDTWFEAISNGNFAGWNHIGISNTSYSVPITIGPPALT